jgi:hypothetical protein
MTKVEIFPFDVCAIDSFKLHIPIGAVTIINPELNETRTNLEIGNDTGVVHSEKIIKTRSKEIEFEGYSIKACIVTRHNVNTRKESQFLELYLHTKILEKDYFKGFTMSSIERVYNKLISTKNFHVDFEIFLLSRVSDVDFKKDIQVEKESFLDFTKYMKSISKDRKVRDKGAYKYTNGNIEWNKRETSTIANPFLKLYYKTDEAKERKSEFFETYFDINNLPSVVRGEATIKRSTEIKKFFNLSSANLIDILKLTSEQINSFIYHSIQSAVKQPPKVKIERKIEGLNTTDQLLYINLSLCLKSLDMTFDAAKDLVLENIPDKSRRSYVKKRMLEIYDVYFKNDTQVKLNTSREDILKKFGFPYN